MFLKNAKRRMPISWVMAATLALSLLLSWPSTAAGKQLNIAKRSQVRLLGSGTAKRVTLVDDRLYVAAGSGGLLIIDVGDPGLPEILASGGIPGVKNVVGVTVNSDGAWLADLGNLSTGPDLQLVDISVAAAAASLAVLDVNSEYGTDVAVAGSFGILGLTSSGSTVRSVKWSGGSQLTSVATFRIVNARNATAPCIRAAANGDMVYVLTEVGLTVLRLGADGRLTRLGSREMLSGTALFVHHARAFVGTADGNCVIVDVSNTTTLRAIGNLKTQGNGVTDISANEGRAYLSVGGDGVEVFDLTDAAGLVSGTRVGAFNTDGEALGLTVDEPYIYVADGAIGMTILEMDPQQGPVVSSMKFVGSGGTISAPASGSLEVVASDADGRVVEVEFRQGSTLLGVDTTAPFSWRVDGLGAGKHTFSAVAKDDSGLTASATVTVTVEVVVDNQPPTVSLESSGQAFGAPASFRLTATASDRDGSVSKVEFFDGASKVGERTSSPYVLELSGVGAGSHSYTARATDNKGLPATSAPIVVVVADPAFRVTMASSGYSAGETASVRIVFTYEGGLTALGLGLQLPSGWRYLSDTSNAQIKPAVDAQGLLEWGWFSGFPASGSEFVLNLGVPSGESGAKTISGVLIIRKGGPELPGVVDPDPLTLEPLAPYHTADVSWDWRFNLSEVLRVAGLFNYAAGGTRTGEYHVQAGSEDGFGEGPGTRSGRKHSADSNGDWKLSLSEVLRVASLFNYSANNQRTGEYHAKNGTEDGYEAGPANRPSVAAIGARDGVRRRSGLMVVSSEQALLEGGTNSYLAGGEVTLSLKANYVVSVTAFGWELDLPTGWSYVSDTGTAQIKPSANQVGTLEWGWFAAFPASGAGFSVTVRVPSGQTGERVIQARALLRDPARTLTSGRLALNPRPSATGPEITTQPAGGLVGTGEGIVLDVGAQGPGLNYQWQLNGVYIPGATESRLELAEITPRNAGRYSVVVRNGAGSATSQAAVVRFFGDVRLLPGMTIAGELGDRFRIEYADSVGGGAPWMVLTNLVHPGGVHLVVDPSGLGGVQRYYRASLVGP